MVVSNFEYPPSCFSDLFFGKSFVHEITCAVYGIFILKVRLKKLLFKKTMS